MEDDEKISSFLGCVPDRLFWQAQSSDLIDTVYQAKVAYIADTEKNDLLAQKDAIEQKIAVIDEQISKLNDDNMAKKRVIPIDISGDTKSGI